MAALYKNPKHLSKSLYYSTLTTTPQKLITPSIFQSTNINPDNLVELITNQPISFLSRHRPIFELSVQNLARSNRHDLIPKLIHTQKKQSPEIETMLKSEPFWIRLITLYSKSGLLDEALDAFNKMGEYECVRTEKTVYAILNAFFDNGQFDKVHELFQTVPDSVGIDRTSVMLHNLILRTFVKENCVESAKIWIGNMGSEYGAEPDIDSYNVLLGAYLKDGNVNGFDGAVKEVCEKGLEFNLAAYNYRISMFCKMKECVKAKKLLYEMIGKGQNPNPSSYNSIIHGFCKVGDVQSAKRVLDGMLVDGYVLPNSFTYNTLVSRMVKNGEFDLALDICKEIIRRKWVPPFDAMAGLVNGLLKISKAEEAKEVVANMKKRLNGPALDSWRKIEATLPLY